MSDDAHLLRQYVDCRSDDAFAELVQRHLGLVYASAMRQLGGDSHLAQDVAQSVFVLLARKSRPLLGHSSLVAWLHTTTYYKASELRRAEHRRRMREQAAQSLHELMQDDMSSGQWERLRPMIDQVLLELKESDREAVLLRYFEERPFAEVAEHLRLSENTAHKRVERALEKLRDRLARRGVTSTAAALGAALGSHALAAPPAGLAATVTSAVASSALPTVVAGSIASFMGTKTAMTSAAAVLLFVAAGILRYGLSDLGDEESASAAANGAPVALIQDGDIPAGVVKEAGHERSAREEAQAVAEDVATADARPGFDWNKRLEEILNSPKLRHARAETVASRVAYAKMQKFFEHVPLPEWKRNQLEALLVTREALLIDVQLAAKGENISLEAEPLRQVHDAEKMTIENEIRQLLGSGQKYEILEHAMDRLPGRLYGIEVIGEAYARGIALDTGQRDALDRIIDNAGLGTWEREFNESLDEATGITEYDRQIATELERVLSEEQLALVWEVNRERNLYRRASRILRAKRAEKK